MPRYINPGDGERKAVVTRIDAATFRYDGLVDSTEWATMKAVAGRSLVTQRRITGATRHVQACNGQFPEVGTLIPAVLLRGGTGVKRSGKAMRSHLTSIADRTKAERDALAILTNAKVRIY